MESRDRSKPRGARALRQELSLRGVDRPVVDAILAERDAASAEDGLDADPDAGAVVADEAAAEKLIARHARTLDRVPDPRVRRQKAYALLARNGFDPDVAARVSAAFLREPEPDESS